jgi:hypothetical protein
VFRPDAKTESFAFFYHGERLLDCRYALSAVGLLTTVIYMFTIFINAFAIGSWSDDHFGMQDHISQLSFLLIFFWIIAALLISTVSSLFVRPFECKTILMVFLKESIERLEKSQKHSRDKDLSNTVRFKEGDGFLKELLAAKSILDEQHLQTGFSETSVPGTWRLGPMPFWNPQKWHQFRLHPLLGTVISIISIAIVGLPFIASANISLPWKSQQAVKVEIIVLIIWVASFLTDAAIVRFFSERRRLALSFSKNLFMASLVFIALIQDSRIYKLKIARSIDDTWRPPTTHLKWAVGGTLSYTCFIYLCIRARRNILLSLSMQYSIPAREHIFFWIRSLYTLFRRMALKVKECISWPFRSHPAFGQRRIVWKCVSVISKFHTFFH